VIVEAFAYTIICCPPLVFPKQLEKLNIFIEALTLTSNLIESIILRTFSDLQENKLKWFSLRMFISLNNKNPCATFVQFDLTILKFFVVALAFVQFCFNICLSLLALCIGFTFCIFAFAFLFLHLLCLDAPAVL